MNPDETLPPAAGNSPAETAREYRDPVCGMVVTAERNAGACKYRHQTYYFCSRGCLKKFQENPENYLAAKSQAESPSGLIGIGMAPPRAAGAPLVGIAPAASGPAEERRAPHAPAIPAAAAGPVSVAGPAAAYTCPMHPEVRESRNVPCPKCGMALESLTPTAPAAKTEYICPMHPEVVRSEPGACPICGMALEPRVATAEEEENPELREMTRRFWVAVALTVPVLVSAMSASLPGNPLHAWASARFWTWFELLLSTPVVVWCGWPFFVRAWQSLVNRSLNMFTLIGLGVSVAYIYSLVAALFPRIFPASFRDATGGVAVYFEAAAAITTLVLLGQVLELRARSRNSSAGGAGAQNRAAHRGRRS
jgi:P-type Cu+ transporter